jgi:hypothetical protein
MRSPEYNWYRLCGKWDFPTLRREKEVHTSPGFNESYLDRLTRRISDPSREAVCTEALYRVLGERDQSIEVVVEYCAGIGMNGFTIQRIIGPSEHYVQDIDEECVRQLAVSLPEAEASLADFFTCPKREADLSVLDFNSFTVLSGSRNPDMMRALGEAFGATRTWATVTDGCNRRFHLNRGSYAEILKTELESFEDYVNACSRWYFDNFGFSVVHVEHNTAASWWLLRRGGFSPTRRENIQPITVNKTEAPYKGLVPLEPESPTDTVHMFGGAS